MKTIIFVALKNWEFKNKTIQMEFNKNFLFKNLVLFQCDLKFVKRMWMHVKSKCVITIRCDLFSAEGGEVTLAIYLQTAKNILIFCGLRPLIVSSIISLKFYVTMIMKNKRSK